MILEHITAILIKSPLTIEMSPKLMIACKIKPTFLIIMKMTHEIWFPSKSELALGKYFKYYE
jgi:hypothetical protein